MTKPDKFPVNLDRPISPGTFSLKNREFFALKKACEQGMCQIVSLKGFYFEDGSPNASQLADMAENKFKEEMLTHREVHDFIVRSRFRPKKYKTLASAEEIEKVLNSGDYENLTTTVVVANDKYAHQMAAFCSKAANKVNSRSKS